MVIILFLVVVALGVHLEDVVAAAPLEAEAVARLDGDFVVLATLRLRPPVDCLSGRELRRLKQEEGHGGLREASPRAEVDARVP